jgi:hypothetical protein
MTPILSFKRGEHDGETVTLGEVVIGHVAPFIGCGNTRAIFTVWLPECRHSQRPASSLESARANVVSEVEKWLCRAGIFYPGQAVEVQKPC